jgi:hypothetical protein
MLALIPVLSQTNLISAKSCLLDFPWFHHPNNICRKVNIIKVLIIPSCYFLHLSSKYEPACFSYNKIKVMICEVWIVIHGNPQESHSVIARTSVVYCIRERHFTLLLSREHVVESPHGSCLRMPTVCLSDCQNWGSRGRESHIWKYWQKEKNVLLFMAKLYSCCELTFALSGDQLSWLRFLVVCRHPSRRMSW